MSAILEPDELQRLTGYRRPAKLKHGAFPPLRLVGPPTTPAPYVRQAAQELAQQRAEAKRVHQDYFDSMRSVRRAPLVRHHANKRRAATINRTPPWANESAIKALYREAERLTRETGEMHHVDHIIPLQGELVSGLHVENNLQVLHWRANVLKRNHFEVEAWTTF